MIAKVPHPPHVHPSQHVDDVTDAVRSGGVSVNHPAAKASLTDKAISTSYGVLGPLSMLAWIGPTVASGVGRVVGWTGAKTGLRPLEKSGRGLQGAVRYIDETSLERVAETTGTKKVIGGISRPLFSGAGAVADRLSKWTRLGASREASHIGKMHQHLGRARDLAGIDLSAAHETVRPHLEAMHQAVTKAASTGHIDMEALSKAHTDFHVAVEAVKESQNKAAKSVTGSAKTVVAKIKGVIGGGAKTASHTGTAVLEKEGEKAVEAIAKSGANDIGKFENAVGRAIEHHHSALAWKNPGAAIKNLPHQIKGASLRRTAMDGSWIALSGVSVIATARDFFKNWKQLRQIQTDVDGKRASTLKLLVGNVSAPVAHARTHLIKTLFAREAVETVGLAVNIKQARGGHISPVALGVQFAGSQAIDGIMGKSMVPMYTALNELHQSGQDIPVEAYAAFIGSTSPEIKARGGAESKFAQELAKQYAAEKAAPALILREIDDGGLMIRVHGIIEASKAKQPVSHAQRLEGEAATREVVGEHTKKLEQQASTRAIEGAGPAV